MATGPALSGAGRVPTISRSSASSSRALATRSPGATLLTTSPLLFPEQKLEAFRRVESNVRLSRYGGDCYAYAMVAAGHADCVIESGLKIYDIAPLIPIIEGAGGIVTNWRRGRCLAGRRHRCERLRRYA